MVLRLSFTADLMRDIGPCVTDISVHFTHDPDVLITVEQRIFFVPHVPSSTSVQRFVRLQTCIGQYDNQSLTVFVGDGYGCVLLSDKLGKLWWRA